MANLKFLKCVSLYSCLVVLIFALTVIIQSMTTSANAGAPILYSCNSPGGGDDDNLYQVNPATGADAGGTQTMTLAGQTIRGCQGLARDPTTGTCWIMVRVGSGGGGDPQPSNRILGTINPATGVITSVGTSGLAIASIAFDSSGTLYGVVGDQIGSGSPVMPETLHTLSKADATPTFFQTLGNGTGGEAIAFNPNDGLMYHLSGNSNLNNNATGKIFETINLNNMTISQITIDITNGLDCEFETSALVHQSGSTFLHAIVEGPSSFYSITDSGVCVLLGTLNHLPKGLAFDCEPPECTIDADCADEDECTIDVCENPGPDSSCSNDFDVENDECFCSLPENEFDERCFTAGPVVIIPTMGQWGMIAATIIIGIFAVFAIRRRTES